MPDTVRAYSPSAARAAVRIGLIGGECTGKSTLAADLAEALRARTDLDIGIVPEVLRAFVARKGRPPLVTEQAGIMKAQRHAEDAAAGAHDLVIADPATMMTAIYSELYFDDPGLWGQAAVDAHEYQVVLWCRPDLPWEPDPGQRDGPDFRERADSLIAARLAVASAWLDPTTRLSPVFGSRQARLDQAVTHAIAAAAAMGVWREGESGFPT